MVAHRMDFEVQGLILPEYGKYWFRLELDGKEIATHPLSVVKDAVPTR